MMHHQRIRKAFVYLDVDKNALVDSKDYHLKVTSLGLKQEFDVSEKHFDQVKSTPTATV